jgi:PAS domain-containing protein
MPAQEIEFILSRQLAEYLSTPIALVDHDGKMIYYNESAEHIVGKRYNESGDIESREWDNRFFNDESFNASLNVLDIPFIKVLSMRHIMQGEYWMRNFEEINQKVLIVSVPLVGMAQRELGAIVYLNLLQRK